ncbi:MAG: hypothetical protein Q7S18_00830 [bacterium]|nr:hypothetical protein [bacterium]
MYNRLIKKSALSFSIFIFVFFLSSQVAKAICPICTIAVGAGVGLSRWLGIDDTIAGLWVGALTVSISFWTLNWFLKKNIKFKGDKFLVIIGYYLIIIAPLYFTGIMGHTFNKIWGIDKLLIGIIVGSLVFYGSVAWYQKIKSKNNNHARFPFQKVAMPVGFLFIASAIFYFITK